MEISMLYKIYAVGAIEVVSDESVTSTIFLAS